MAKKTDTVTNPQEASFIDPEEFGRQISAHIKAKGGIAAVDPEAMLASMMKGAMEALLQAEMDEHLGYEKHSIEGYGSGNSRNGSSGKRIRGDFGEIEISTPRDRNGTFEPEIIGKRESSVGKFTDKIISLYARGMTTREISEHLQEMYNIDVSAQFISNATERISKEATEWQNRPLEPVYPVVYVDGLRVSMRTEKNGVKKVCVYVVLGVSVTGKQDVLGLWVEETEGAKFWLKVFEDLKLRGVNDIVILCGDGLKGLPEAVETVFPQADIQLCVVHQIRYCTQFVPHKDKKQFCADMKPIYTAPTIEAAELALEEFAEKWEKKYPMAIASWRRNWEKLTAFFRYPAELRKIIYTTNTIESLNSQLRKNTRNRKVFPCQDSMIKLLYLNVKNITGKWTKRQNWTTVMNKLSILFPERINNALDENWQNVN